MQRKRAGWTEPWPCRPPPVQIISGYQGEGLRAAAPTLLVPHLVCSLQRRAAPQSRRLGSWALRGDEKCGVSFLSPSCVGGAE